MTSCDLNAFCRRSEIPLMHGTEAYFSLLVAGFFGLSRAGFIVRYSKHPIWVFVDLQSLLNMPNFLYSNIFLRNQGLSSK